MTKRKFCDVDIEESSIKKICKNVSLVQIKSEAPVLSILRKAAQKLWSSTTQNSESINLPEKCRICAIKLASQSQAKCNFCEYAVCHQCIIDCNQCGYQFCSFCAVNVYSPVGDIGRCLTCF
ncbi:uncharacterized protein LOC107360563 [Tetranychus urticae]|uniref:RING-type domain-containing protein n=1 Tax=Tetranychus urticae TaxID=32264 RepID=T1K490_TETUR|nr:uncharacterized protein LOC107360563 [Tetranychus urticae]